MTGADRERRADLVFAAATFAVSLVFLWQSARLPASRFDPLGPGWFPFGLSILLAGLSGLALGLLLLRRRLGRAEVSLVVGVNEEAPTHRPRPGLALFSLAAVVAYAAVLHWTAVGFRAATVALIAALGIALSRRSPREIAIALAVAVAMGFGLTFLFRDFLLLELP